MSQVLIELLHGKGAHVDPIACVEDLSAELAAQHVSRFPHSIGQLVFHMNYWMGYELRRIRGEQPPYPTHSAESFPADSATLDAQQWDRYRRDLAWFIAELIALAQSPRGELDRQIESTLAASQQQSSTLNSLEAILWQMVAHNSYHTGQIATIRRALNAWPPKAGSDSW
jgi:uncharacterized damage-inducible protein DinB